MIKRLLTLFALVAVSMTALAQDYPSKAIRVLVPYPPGGAGDTVARVVMQKVSEALNQPVIVDNRPGANTIIAAEFVSKAPPDGYTLLLTFDPPHTTLPLIMRKVPFDAVKDFTPVTIIAKAPNALAVPASSPIKTLKEYIAHAKANPGKVFLGTTGNGTIQHFAIERMNALANMKVVHVPYKGGAAAMSDLLGGQIDSGMTTLISVMPHVKTGKLRVLAVTDSARARAAPDLPTVAEAGLPGYTMPDLWIGVFGPPGMAPALASRIQQEIVKAANAPTARTRLEDLGFELILSTPQQMRDVMARGAAIYRQVAKDAGIQPE